jgi:hypothetical protein
VPPLALPETLINVSVFKGYMRAAKCDKQPFRALKIVNMSKNVEGVAVGD